MLERPVAFFYRHEEQTQSTRQCGNSFSLIMIRVRHFHNRIFYYWKDEREGIQYFLSFTNAACNYNRLTARAISETGRHLFYIILQLTIKRLINLTTLIFHSDIPTFIALTPIHYKVLTKRTRQKHFVLWSCTMYTYSVCV